MSPSATAVRHGRCKRDVHFISIKSYFTSAEKGAEGDGRGGGLDSICCRFTLNMALMFVLGTDSGNVAISSSVDTHFVLFPSTAAATLSDSLQWSGRQWLQWNASWIGSKCNHLFPLSVCSAFINTATFSPLSNSILLFLCFSFFVFFFLEVSGLPSSCLK